MRQTVAESALIFLHIPRTAGTTLHRVIERQYRPEHIFSTGALAHEAIEKFKGLSEARRAEIRVLKGHMGFGLHEFIPRPSIYFTVLRENFAVVGLTERFDERYGSSFAGDLETFRRLNRLLSPVISHYWTSLKWSLRAFLRKLFLQSTG